MKGMGEIGYLVSVVRYTSVLGRPKEKFWKVHQFHSIATTWRFALNKCFWWASSSKVFVCVMIADEGNTQHKLQVSVWKFSTCILILILVMVDLQGSDLRLHGFLKHNIDAFLSFFQDFPVADPQFRIFFCLHVVLLARGLNLINGITFLWFLGCPHFPDPESDFREFAHPGVFLGLAWGPQLCSKVC